MIKNKLYLLTGDAEVYDGATNIWTQLPDSPVYNSYETCSVVWRDSFILLSSFWDAFYYQKFNLTTQTWSVINTRAPIRSDYSGCVLLPSDEIVLAGNSNAQLYNIVTNTWTILPNSTYYYSSVPAMVQLGKRFFLIDSEKNQIEEFNYPSKTWKNVAVPKLLSWERFGTVALEIPAGWFAHLPGGCKGIK
jgi:hypothetical protein